jgi:predicted HicB family RNase H-like nuclease
MESTTTTIRVSKEVRKRLNVMSAESELSVNEVLEAVLDRDDRTFKKMERHAKRLGGRKAKP